MTTAYMPTIIRYSRVRVRRTVRCSLVLSVLIAGACSHRASTPVILQQIPHDSTHAEATRAELQALAITTEREATTAKDADARKEKEMQVSTIRERLRDGDFGVGDRVLLSIRGDSVSSDTVTVRAGRVIRLENMPDISLQGVLRSELEDYLTHQLARYLKRPEVQTTSLVRVAVMGAVNKPGFYQLPADLALADAIMLAGGPTQSADVNNTKVQRDNDVVYSSDALSQAVAKGATLDQLNIRPGDQIQIGERHKTNWGLIASIVGITAGLVSTAVVLTRR
jgi:protein involved in polysaccharide export with SLBB domain